MSCFRDEMCELHVYEAILNNVFFVTAVYEVLTGVQCVFPSFFRVGMCTRVTYTNLLDLTI